MELIWKIRVHQVIAANVEPIRNVTGCHLDSERVRHFLDGHEFGIITKGGSPLTLLALGPRFGASSLASENILNPEKGVDFSGGGSPSYRSDSLLSRAAPALPSPGCEAFFCTAVD
jgi:hypothetical protein